MRYTIEILPEAREQIKALPKKVRGQIGRKIDRLAAEPFPPGSTKLEGQDGRGGAAAYRIVSGDYRILYRVDQGKVLVTVVKVGNRKDVYRNL